MQQGWLRRVLREPLVHFLIAGFAVFMLLTWRNGPVEPESRTITLSAEKIQQLAEIWTQTWQRPPTPAEVDGLIRDYIKEEVYNREARRLGLDVDDAIIRRRLRSKMEYLATAEAESAVPSDAVLQDWLDKNTARYAEDGTISFDQIYLGDGTNADINQNAARLLRALNSGTDWQDKGAALALPKSYDTANKARITRDFGPEFADATFAQPKGRWVGPVQSGFGAHLVRIRGIQPGHNRPLAEVRAQVENDWRAATIKAREAAAYQTLLDGYTIRIAQP